MKGLRSASRALSSAETMKRNWCGSCSERSRKASPSASSLVGIVEPAGIALAGDAVAQDVPQVRPRRAEVAGDDARVARLDDDAPAAGRDQTGGGATPGAHAALGRWGRCGLLPPHGRRLARLAEARAARDAVRVRAAHRGCVRAWV